MKMTYVLLICVLAPVAILSGFFVAGLNYTDSSKRVANCCTSNDLPKIDKTVMYNSGNPNIKSAIPPNFPHRKSQLIKEISDLFITSEEVIFSYRRNMKSKYEEYGRIVINDTSALSLFSEYFDYDSLGKRDGRGLPMSPVFMSIKFMPSNRNLIFEDLRRGDFRYFFPEECYNYYGEFSLDFLLFCQYYFSEAIDEYGEFNMVDKKKMYMHPENQNEYIRKKLAEFSSVVLPLACP